MDWSYLETEEFEKKKRKWPKKYGRELAGVVNNLSTLYDALRCGATLESVCTFGFVHSEPMGVLGVDQKGGGQALKETRLYLYPEKETHEIHLITLGDKKSQAADIKFCKEYVQGLIEKRKEQNGG